MTGNKACDFYAVNKGKFFSCNAIKLRPGTPEG